MTTIDEEVVSQSFECPDCDAGPAERCVHKSGKPTEAHRLRRDSAELALRKERIENLERENAHLKEQVQGCIKASNADLMRRRNAEAENQKLRTQLANVMEANKNMADELDRLRTETP